MWHPAFDVSRFDADRGLALCARERPDPLHLEFASASQITNFLVRELREVHPED